MECLNPGRDHVRIVTARTHGVQVDYRVACTSEV